jgi:hypothetical protein
MRFHPLDDLGLESVREAIAVHIVRPAVKFQLGVLAELLGSIQRDRRAKSFSHGFYGGRTTLLRPAKQELFVAIHTANLTLDRDASQRHRKCAVLRGIGRKLVNDQRKAAPAGQLPGRREAAALGCWHQRLGRRVSSLI